MMIFFLIIILILPLRKQRLQEHSDQPAVTRLGALGSASRSIGCHYSPFKYSEDPGVEIERETWVPSCLRAR